MFGCVFGYAVIGILVLSAVFAIHLYKAERQGYWAFDYWEAAFPMIEKKISIDQLIWSILIWPVRLIQFIAIVGVFYDIYDYRKCGPRRRKGWL